jgi:hypothetical protein
MLPLLYNYFAERRERQEAIAAARQYFEDATGSFSHRGLASVIHADPSSMIVRVCYGRTKPPGRAWFRVARSPRSIEELAFEDVTKYGERPWL